MLVGHENLLNAFKIFSIVKQSGYYFVKQHQRSPIVSKYYEGC